MVEIRETDPHSKFAPNFKPNEMVPSSFVFETKYPYVKKTRAMGRVEYKFDAKIGDVLSWFYREEGRPITEVAKIVDVTPETAKRWIKKFEIQPKRKEAKISTEKSAA